MSSLEETLEVMLLMKQNTLSISILDKLQYCFLKVDDDKDTMRGGNEIN
jgi:hypothetical protein